MKRAILALIFSATLLTFMPSATSNVIEVNKNLILKNSVPLSLASSTLKIELVPDNYPQEIHYKNAEVCVTSIEQPNCYQRMDIEKFSQLQSRRISSDPKSKYSVINVDENTFILNFISVGKVLIQIRKFYYKDQQSEYDNLTSEIQIPLEITDVSKGGFTIGDLRAAGVNILTQPVLNCPEVKKNFNGFINCEATYYYKNQGITLQVEPSESFKICAYRGDPNQIYGCGDRNSYLSKDLKLALNTVQKIRIPIYKDYVTSIHLESVRSGEAVRQVQSNVLTKKQTSTKKGTTTSQWNRNCKNITAYSSTNDRLQIVDGSIQGGTVTTILKVCEYVRVP